MTDKHKEFITAVGNRCSISDPSDKCYKCKVVKTSVAYTEELEAEKVKLQMECIELREFKLYLRGDIHTLNSDNPHAEFADEIKKRISELELESSK